MTDMRTRALAYLRDGNVTVWHTRTRRGDRAPQEVVAVVNGHHARYQIQMRHQTWSCTCQAVTSDGTTCAHAAAVQLVTGHPSPAAKQTGSP